MFSFFSFELGTSEIDVRKNSAITMYWDDSQGGPINISITEKNHVESTTEKPTFTSSLPMLANPYKLIIKDGHSSAGTNGNVLLDFQNVHSQFPTTAFSLVRNAMGGRNSLFFDFFDCQRFTILPLPTLTFSDPFGKVAFIFSKENYFVRTNNEKCFFTAHDGGNNSDWVIGAALVKTHPIEFKHDGVEMYRIGIIKPASI